MKIRIIVTIFYICLIMTFPVIAEESPKNLYKIEDIAINLSLLDNLDPMQIKDILFKNKIENSFGNNYLGGNGSSTLFDNSNKIIGFAEFYQLKNFYLLLLEKKVNENFNYIEDVVIIPRTKINKLLSVSGSLDGVYLRNLIVITSDDINKPNHIQTDVIYLFNTVLWKIEEIQNDEIEIYYEE